MKKRGKKNSKLQTVAVLFGGKSVEHDISIITGTQLANALNREKFEVLPIYISKENEWFWNEKFFDISHFCHKNPLENAKRVCFLPQRKRKKDDLKEQKAFLSRRKGGEDCEKMGSKLRENKNPLGENERKIHNCERNLSAGELFVEKNGRWKFFRKCHFVFVALHGNHGENGGVQGLLEMCGVPYSSPDVFGSAVCMNKLATKFVCQSLGIKVVKHKVFFEKDFSDKTPLKKLLKDFCFPLIVKPNNLGSSIGISFCENYTKLKNALSFAFLFDKEVLVEEAVQNLREFNLAVLGNRFGCEFSQIEEVCVEKDFLTFENKYIENKVGRLEVPSRIIPAKIDKISQDTIRDFGEKIFLSLGLKGVVRVDFLMNDKSGEIFLNEVNSIPGSFACYLFKNKYTFEKLLSKVMEYALEEWKSEEKKVVRFSSSVIEKFAENAPFIAKTGAGKVF